MKVLEVNDNDIYGKVFNGYDISEKLEICWYPKPCWLPIIILTSINGFDTPATSGNAFNNLISSALNWLIIAINDGWTCLVLSIDDFNKFLYIKKDVVIVGVSTRVEIWDSEKWDNYTSSDSLDVTKIASQMSNLGI